MALLGRIERALTSTGVNRTWGPMIVVAAQSAEVSLSFLTVDHLTPLKTAERCVSEVTLCCRNCATRRRMDVTAPVRGRPVASCPIDYPLTQFFRVVKRRLTKVVAAQVLAEAAVAWVG